MTIRWKLLSYGIAAVFTCVLLGAIGGFAINNLVEANASNLAMSGALRQHADADMMHDALRTDVGNAREALEGESTATSRKILVATTAHAHTFQLDIKGLRATNLSPVHADQQRPARERCR